MDKARDENIIVVAETTKSIFDELITAGFTENQALTIIGQMLKAAVNGGQK